MFGNALADILRSKGIGPTVKWVDDFLFIQVPSQKIPDYNQLRELNRVAIENNGGRKQTGGRIWYKGRTLAEVGAEQFAEDLTYPVKHL